MFIHTLEAACAYAFRKRLGKANSRGERSCVPAQKRQSCRGAGKSSQEGLCVVEKGTVNIVSEKYDVDMSIPSLVLCF